MSETDSFIDEVTEEVRRDRLFALMKRYGWIGILGVLLIVSGAGYNEWRKAQAEDRARTFGDAMIAAMDGADRAAALAAVPATGSQIALKQLLLAATVGTSGTADAVTALRSVANDASQPASLRALALLKAIVLAGPTLDPAIREASLAELAVPGAPFRQLAMEQQAVMLVESGKTDAAVALLRQILQEPELTAGLQQRATGLIVALGADPAAQ